MEVERATVSDLSERPLSARLRELEELFDAAVLELRSAPVVTDGLLHEELAEALERHSSIGVPFTLALLGAPSGDPSGCDARCQRLLRMGPEWWMPETVSLP